MLKLTLKNESFIFENFLYFIYIKHEKKYNVNMVNKWRDLWIIVIK